MCEALAIADPDAADDEVAKLACVIVFSDDAYALLVVLARRWCLMWPGLMYLWSAGAAAICCDLVGRGWNCRMRACGCGRGCWCCRCRCVTSYELYGICAEPSPVAAGLNVPSGCDLLLLPRGNLISTGTELLLGCCCLAVAEDEALGVACGSLLRVEMAMSTFVFVGVTGRGWRVGVNGKCMVRTVFRGVVWADWLGV